MRGLHADWEPPRSNLTLGALPLPLFANGHGYFVQSAHVALGVSPFAVHATYSLDWHDGAAKRQRFREAGLWDADPPTYFSGKFLALNFSIPPAVQAALRRYRLPAPAEDASPEAGTRRGGQSGRDGRGGLGGRGGRGGLRGLRGRRRGRHGGGSHAPGQDGLGRREENNIGVHAAALRAYLAELRDALALARHLRRALILPRWVCYADKLWAGSDNIIGTGFMYPGSQDAPFLPFACPMDHVLSPHEWAASSVDYRDASFLLSPRLPREVAESVVDVRLLGRKEYDTWKGGGLGREGSFHHLEGGMEGGSSQTVATLPLGTTAHEAADLLQRSGAGRAAVLRLPHARGLLCGIGGASAQPTLDFNRLARRVLRAPPWCTRCDRGCKLLLERWLSSEQIGRPRGFGEWCLHTPPPMEFRHGTCTPNIVV